MNRVKIRSALISHAASTPLTTPNALKRHFFLSLEDSGLLFWAIIVVRCAAGRGTSTELCTY